MSDTSLTPTPSTSRALTYREHVAKWANAQLVDILGSDKAKAASARLAMAYATLAKVNPKIEQATPASVAMTLAMCALTELVPGGAVPTCYVIPRERRFKDERGEWHSSYELNWQIGARGLQILANRAGYQVQAYPYYPGRVPQFDAMGRLVPPTERLPPVERTVENLIGVLVIARRLSDGAEFGRVFVEADIIDARRAVSDAYKRGMELEHTYGRNKGKPKSDDEISRDRSSPWFQWQEEMSIKTALVYAIRRGIVPLDDIAGQALTADAASDARVIDVESEPVAAPVTTGRSALGLRPAPALPDHGEPEDFAADLTDAERAAIVAAEAESTTPPENI